MKNQFFCQLVTARGLNSVCGRANNCNRDVALCWCTTLRLRFAHSSFCTQWFRGSAEVGARVGARGSAVLVHKFSPRGCAQQFAHVLARFDGRRSVVGGRWAAAGVGETVVVVVSAAVDSLTVAAR